MTLPDKEGIWLVGGIEVEVHQLDFGEFCIWGPDVGITYSGQVDTQECWTTDEWQGHIPVAVYDSEPTNWKFIQEKQP